jgi:cyclic-di-GMP-binding biofilm dispersal mediator protein
MWNGWSMDMRIVIVGASGVLGSGLTERLAGSGAHVIGTASGAESLDRIPAAASGTRVLDLEDPASIHEAVEAIAAGGSVDGVVIASGIVAFGTIVQTPAHVADQLMQVNHLGPAAVIAGLLPALTASAGEGRGPFVASISGVVAERAFPGMAAYVASKTAHSAWLRALRTETRRPLIRVIDARPGHTETGLAGRAVFGTAPAFPTGMTADHVCDVIVAGIQGDGTDLASTDFGG